MNGKRTGNRNPLTLATGKLVGIAVQHIILQAAHPHHIQNMLLHLRGTMPVELVCHQALLNDLSHRHTRVEGGIRILENQLQIFAQKAHFGIFQPSKVNAVIQHLLVLQKLRIVKIWLFRRRDLLIQLGHMRFLLIPLCGQRGASIKQFLAFRRTQRFLIVIGSFIQKQVNITDPFIQCGTCICEQRLLVKQRGPRFGIPHQESAQDLGNVSLRSLCLCQCQVFVLQVKKRRLIT